MSIEQSLWIQVLRGLGAVGVLGCRGGGFRYISPKKNRAGARFQGYCVTLANHSVVERMGIEPTTSTMRTWRSPS